MRSSPGRGIAFLVAALAASAVLPACNRDPKAPRLVLPPSSGPVEPAADPALRLVTAVSFLRREPTDHAKAKGDVVATLHRGERVTLLETRDAWSRVRTSGGQEGWLRSSALAPAAGVQEGTVLAAAFTFDRPDLLASNARRKLEPGTLLFVRNAKDLFTEVDAGPGASTWVLTDRISTQAADVGAARLVEKARYLQRNDRKDEAREVLVLLRSSFPSSPLVPVVAIELGELAPDGGVEAPSGPGKVP